MRDSTWMEPDIDGRNANGDPVEYDYKSGGYVVSSDSAPSYQIYDSTPSYKYEFRTEEELVQSAVFQKHLKMSLAFKDKIIRDYQNELLKLGIKYE